MKFFKKYWYFVLLAFLVTTLGILKLSTKTVVIPPSLPPTENSWNGIVPGSSSIQQVEKTLGQPIKIERVEGKTIYLYPSEIENWPNQIFVSEQNNKTEGVKRFFPPKEENYSFFINKYGNPDKELFGPHSQSGFSVFVFLEKGLAIVANKKSDLVLEIWYFSPTTLEEFLASWGKNLSEAPTNLF